MREPLILCHCIGNTLRRINSHRPKDMNRSRLLTSQGHIQTAHQVCRPRVCKRVALNVSHKAICFFPAALSCALIATRSVFFNCFHASSVAVSVCASTA